MTSYEKMLGAVIKAMSEVSEELKKERIEENCNFDAAIKEMDELLKYPWPDDVDANKMDGSDNG